MVLDAFTQFDEAEVPEIYTAIFQMHTFYKINVLHIFLNI